MICTEQKIFLFCCLSVELPCPLACTPWLLLPPWWMSDFWLLSDSNWRVAGGREDRPGCASAAAPSQHLPGAPGGGQPQQRPCQRNGDHHCYWGCQWQPPRMQSFCLQVWSLFRALVLPCCPRPVCRRGHIPRPTAGGSSGHLSSACPLNWAVVHHNAGVTVWVASSMVAYLDLGFNFKSKSMFCPVIYEEFKSRNRSCFDGKCVCFKQERSKWKYCSWDISCWS